MPVIGIQTELLAQVVGRERLDALGRDALLEELAHLGCDVEGYARLRRFRCRRCGHLVEITETQDPPAACEACGADFRAAPGDLEERGESEVIRMELLAVRPDMFDPGGLGRVLRAYLGHEKGMPSYPVEPARVSVDVAPEMGSEACPRPAIACAVLRGLELDEDRIKVLMKLQENLHWALGRDRKHASIGVYDLSTVEPPFRYRSVGPDELRFVPLGFDPEDPTAALTPAEVLERHPKGRAFARLLRGWPRYPLLEDARGRVLSLPPIINSEATRVTESTRDFFIDVTGTDELLVGRALNVLVTSLLELVPGSRVEAVEIRRANGRRRTTPDLSPQEVLLDPGETARLLGIELSRERVRELLGRMGHRVEEAGRHLRVLVPAWRSDVLHPRDLMEDVAIAYGYHNIVPTVVPTFSVGGPLPVEEQSGLLRRAMTGLGFQEVMTLHLSDEERSFDALRRPRHERYVRIENPISVHETLARITLLPGLLQLLQLNTHRELPQRIFELGDVTLLDEEAETGAREHRRLAAALIDSTAGFADLRPVLEAALAEQGWELATEPLDSPTYLPGRGARVVALRGERRLELGEMGELHPEVLEAFRLRHPVVAFEIEIEPLRGAC